MKKAGKKKTVKASSKKKAKPAAKKKKTAAPKKKKTAAKKNSKPAAKKKVAKKKAVPVKKKKAVATKKKVAKAVKKKTKPVAKKKTNKKFPGYPHYPAGQDIMNKKGLTKTVLDEEKDKALSGRAAAKGSVAPPKRRKPKSEDDISQQELDLIGNDELNNDMGEDEDLKKRPWEVDMAGDDLDIPGSELDDDMEDIGSEDEENNNYSIGGDRHDDLEEDKEEGR